MDTIIKKGILHFMVLQQLKHLQSQQAHAQNINQPGIHKIPKIKNIIIGERCLIYFLLFSFESPSFERIFIKFITTSEGSTSSSYEYNLT